MDYLTLTIGDKKNDTYLVGTYIYEQLSMSINFPIKSSPPPSLLSTGEGNKPSLDSSASFWKELSILLSKGAAMPIACGA